MISTSKCDWRLKPFSASAALLLLLTSSPAFALTDLDKNADFAGAASGELSFDTTVPDWSAPDFPAGYTLIWDAGAADTTGAPSIFTSPATNPPKLWGPADGSNNGLTLPPDGGAIVGAAASFHDGPLTQTLNGLTAGKPVTVTFSWAAGQQFGFSGASQDGWAVSLGSQTKDTSEASIASHGFSGWKTATLTFTPASSSEVLKFMAIGSGPDAESFSLVSGVNATQAGVIPEPSTWAMMLLGFVVLGFAGYRQTRMAKPQAA